MTSPRPRAVLVGVELPDLTPEEHRSSLAELGRLAKTLGAEVVATVTQKRGALSHGAVLGTGKLEELARWTGGKGVVPMGPPAKKNRIERKAAHQAAWEERVREHRREFGGGEEEGSDAGASPPPADDDDETIAGAVPREERATLVVVDHDITPSQARNLEKACGVPVLDRTAVILEIFQRHARSREARIQVEIARLRYMAPRIRDQGIKHDRQRGGIGGKGAGESALEIDRRKVRDRIAELERDLEAVERTRVVRRARRADELRVALVGYTNAGKSSWMRALTGSEVLVEDKLFATLDTTVRVMQPEQHPRVLVSDTVGFIKRLPHDLVASFRSTLDEALGASLLVHVADGADPAVATHVETTTRVLAEIGAGEVPSLLVLNKADRFDAETRERLAVTWPGALLLSAHRPPDVERLRAALVEFFERDMVEEDVFLPYAQSALLPEIHGRTRVVSEKHQARGTRFRLRGLPEALARIRSLL